MPPSALLVISKGSALSVRAVYHGFVEVSPIDQPDYRGFAVRDGALVAFARDVELRPGMSAHAGTRAKVAYLAKEGVYVAASDGEDHLVRCDTLSSAALPPFEPTLRDPRLLREGVRLLDSDGGTVLDLAGGERVDLVRTDGTRALVRAWRSGFSFTGWVPVKTLEPFGEGGGLIIEDWGGEMWMVAGVFEPIGSTEPGTPCEDRAVLKAGARLSTGPKVDPDQRPESIPRRELPPIDHDIEVTVERTAGDDRGVVVPSPVAEVESVTAWVAADSLDRLTCVDEGGSR